MRRYLLAIMILLLLVVSIPNNGYAVCKGKFFDPITDIDWWGIFPISIGGITIFKSPIPTPKFPGGSPICICGKPPRVRVGIKVGFWDPARLDEIVKDAWCFPSIGTGLKSSGFLNGSSTEKNAKANEVFRQAHWIWMDVFSLVGLFVDYSCFSPMEFDIAYITEVDPSWNSDIISFILEPESLLFANPLAQVTCAVDSIAATMQYPLDPLFWCMGTWGSSYPLTGHWSGKDKTAAAAAIGARLIYKLGREGILWDSAVSYCYSFPSLIWFKSHYRMQEARPLRSAWVIPIGMSDLPWGVAANPPISGGHGAEDNFLWVIFKERACCMGIGL